MNEFTIFQKSIADYFTTDILKLILYPLLGSVIVLYLLFFTAAGYGLDLLDNTQLEIQKHEIQIEDGNINEIKSNESYTGNSIIDFLLKFTLTSWIVGFLVYALGIFLIGYLSVFISLIIIGFLTPKILAIIHSRHYANLKIQSNFSFFDVVVKLIKSAFIMILLFFLLMPFYFIPFINIIAINLPFYYFFHKVLHYDIAATITTKEQFIQLYYGNKTSMRLRTIGFYTLSLIPFAAFVLTIFFVVYLGHVYFLHLKELEKKKYLG